MPTSGPVVGVTVTNDLQIMANGVRKLSAKLQAKIWNTVEKNPLSMDTIFGKEKKATEPRRTLASPRY